MDCQQFQARMQDLLDQRRAIELDEALREHARDCAHCAGELQLWCRLAGVFPTPETGHRKAELQTQPRSPSLRHAARLAVAASLLVLVTCTWWWLDGDDKRTTQQSANESTFVVRDDRGQSEQDPIDAMPQRSTAGLDKVDPMLWWQDVQNRDWVNSTMPTVRNVQQSVAPIGRTLVRAVTILTFGAGTQTS